MDNGILMMVCQIQTSFPGEIHVFVNRRKKRKHPGTLFATRKFSRRIVKSPHISQAIVTAGGMELLRLSTFCSGLVCCRLHSFPGEFFALEENDEEVPRFWF